MQIELKDRGLIMDYEMQGPDQVPTVLLIMGLGLQRVSWPANLIEALLAGGLRVLTADNRDAGLSVATEAPIPSPSLLRAFVSRAMGRPVTTPYTLQDMADDYRSLCTALGIARVHVVGVSLGGMIGQAFAAQYPQQVASLCSVMSSAGPATTPWPRLSLLPFLLRPPSRTASLERRVQHYQRLMTALGHSTDEHEQLALRARLRLSLSRAYRPEATARQLLAINAEPDRSAQVRSIRCPVRIIHGDADPLIPLAAAKHMQRLLPDARMHIVKGLGHVLPEAWMPELAALIVDQVRSAQGP